MVPEEWPIAGVPAEVALEPAARSARGRLATVRRDFFLDPAQRLTEQERALMTTMLHALVADIADELRSALPPESAAANDDDNADIVAELSSRALLDDPQLIELLLRRADEEQIFGAVRARQSRREARFLQPLVSDEDPSVAASAMALILARGRRRDRFGQVRIAFDDLPQGAASRLVHSIAAALRPRVVSGAKGGPADRLLADAAAAIVTRQEPAKSLDALTRSLVQLLSAASRLHDELVVLAADEGELAFLAEILSERAGVPLGEARGMVREQGGAQLTLLLRIAGVSREVAARILAGLEEVLGVTDPAREIARFDALPAEEVEAARAWSQLDPHYRAALAALGHDDGNRAY